MCIRDSITRASWWGKVISLMERRRAAACFTCGESPWEEPVSYTHLDVYKRQFSIRLENWPFCTTLTPSLMVMYDGEIVAYFPDASKVEERAVSYTHLC